MKQHSSAIILTGIFLIGLCLLLYPTFSNWWNSFHQTKAIEIYSEQVADLDSSDYEEIWNDAWNYNRSLMSRRNSYVLTEEQSVIYENLLDIGNDGTMGYIEIPAIDVILPIYHGANESVLQTAVGHLEWTSLPVGGESSHCVLSGHRGLPSAKLFTDIDRLTEGDIFILYVLNEALAYQVDQILTVEPQEVHDLEIVEGEDLCTLVTCTPYGINSHRLLVRGHRTDVIEFDQLGNATESDVPRLIVIWILVLMLLFFVSIYFITTQIKRKKVGEVQNA